MTEMAHSCVLCTYHILGICIMDNTGICHLKNEFLRNATSSWALVVFLKLSGDHIWGFGGRTYWAGLYKAKTKLTTMWSIKWNKSEPKRRSEICLQIDYCKFTNTMYICLSFKEELIPNYVSKRMGFSM